MEKVTKQKEVCTHSVSVADKLDQIYSTLFCLSECTEIDLDGVHLTRSLQMVVDELESFIEVLRPTLQMIHYQRTIKN